MRLAGVVAGEGEPREVVARDARRVRPDGDVARPVRLAVSHLLAWPQHRVKVAFDCLTSGVQHHSFAGPLLREVLCDAGPGFDPPAARTGPAS